MNQVRKYLWGSACILYTLSFVSTLAMGYTGWWIVLGALLALGSFAIWRRA